MNVWTSLLRGLLVGSEMGGAGGALLIRIALATAALLCALAALGLLLAAFYLYLAALLSAPAAALLTGILVALVGLVLVGLAWWLGERDRRRARARAPAQSANQEEVLRLVETARETIASHPIDAVLMALVAGAVLGGSPNARKAVKDLLR